MSYTNDEVIEVRAISEDHQTIHARVAIPKDTLLGFFDGKAMLIEFDYDGKPTPSIPFIDTLQERRDMWLLKKYGLPSLYWTFMMRGLA